jgi:hypothetical protein
MIYESSPGDTVIPRSTGAISNWVEVVAGRPVM